LTVARLAKDSIAIPFDYSEGWQQREQDALDAAAKSARSKAEGEFVGEILRWQRADGYAVYMVVKQKPLTLAHVGVGDAYSIEPALIRGLNLADVREMVIRERKIREMFPA
jgi:hypothetical protein